MINSYWVIPDSVDDIAHYGVKGMKWGVRRYQNEDGTLTSLGKRREDLKNVQRRPAKGAQEKAQKKVDVAYAAREFNKEKTRQRLKADGYKKTKRQLANEKKFRDQGFTDDEAEIMAANRRRGVRIAMAVGGVTLAAIGAYAAYRHYDRITDRILTAGSELGRVSITDSEGLREGFYAFRKKVKRDSANYEGMYAKALSDGGRTVFSKSLKTAGNIKIASERNAQKVLADLLKNDEAARKQVYWSSSTVTKKQELLQKLARRDLNRGKYDSKFVYDYFNLGLAGAWGGRDEEKTQLKSRFYNALKDKGYGAIRDVNDARYSGYRSKDPLIFFDVTKVATKKVSELPKSEINRKNRLASLRVEGLSFAEIAPVGVAAVVGANSLNRAAERKFIREYRKLHPQSKMTDTEILRSLKL